MKEFNVRVEVNKGGIHFFFFFLSLSGNALLMMTFDLPGLVSLPGHCFPLMLCSLKDMNQ